MVNTVRFNVPQTAMEYVDTLMDHVQFVREAGRVTLAIKVQRNDIWYLQSNIWYLNFIIVCLLIIEIYYVTVHGDGVYLVILFIEWRKIGIDLQNNTFYKKTDKWKNIH